MIKYLFFYGHACHGIVGDLFFFCHFYNQHLRIDLPIFGPLVPVQGPIAVKKILLKKFQHIISYKYISRNSNFAFINDIILFTINLISGQEDVQGR